MKFSKAYVSSIISILCLVFYLLGYYLGYYTDAYEATTFFYIIGLVWFEFINWWLGIFQLITAGVLKFKFHKPCKAHIISGVFVLFLQGLMFAFGYFGIYLSA